MNVPRYLALDSEFVFTHDVEVSLINVPDYPYAVLAMRTKANPLVLDIFTAKLNDKGKFQVEKKLDTVHFTNLKEKEHFKKDFPSGNIPAVKELLEEMKEIRDNANTHNDIDNEK